MTFPEGKHHGDIDVCKSRTMQLLKTTKQIISLLLDEIHKIIVSMREVISDKGSTAFEITAGVLRE